MRAIRGVVLVLLLSASMAPPAFGGGWWSNIGLEGQPIGIGETLDLRVPEVMFRSIEEAEEAKQRGYFAYLVRDFDRVALDEAMTHAAPGEWWEPTSEPILAGTVALTAWDANLAEATVKLDVPQVPQGKYHLMLCDFGCGAALGNLIPSRVGVTEDIVAAQTTRRLQQAEADLTTALQRTRHDLRRTGTSLQRALTRDARQGQRIDKLELQIAEAQKPDSPPWILFAGWFFAGAAAALLATRRRRSKPSPEAARAERIPDDARELIDAP